MSGYGIMYEKKNSSSALLASNYLSKYAKKYERRFSVDET